MAKKSRQRFGRNRKDQSGCMWSLINIFDFRQGRTSQKLLQDRKRGSKRVIGAAYSEISLESLTASCEVCEEVDGNMQGGTSTIATSKPSVKELMEEEMCGVQHQKQHDSTVNGDTKQNQLLVDVGHVKKIHRRARSKASLDLDTTYASVSAKDLVDQKPNHRKHKSASSVDLNVMVEELCSRFHHNNANSLSHTRDGDNEDLCALEEKMWEATKVLVDYFAKGRSFPIDGKIQPSKELVDALEILDSNKVVFLKLLQDPSSEFVKHVRGLQDIRVEEGKFKVLTGTDMFDRHLGDDNKQPSFFWRRFKGVERNSSKKSGTSGVLNKIIVLKPGPPGSRNMDMTLDTGLLPESPRNLSDNGQIERISSAFSFSEFMKKLRHAMRKEQQHDISDNGLPLRKTANREKKVGGETVGVSSPSRDHFFIERIPKSSVGVKKVDKIGKSKDGSRVNLDQNAPLSPEQRISSIYAEAKKHLAEIVGNSDSDVDTHWRQIPKPLGRILSYSGYNSPAIYSPRNKEPDDTTCESRDNDVSSKNEETTRLLYDGEDRASDKACQCLENYGNVQVNQYLKINSCIDVDHFIHETNVPLSEPSILDGVAREISIGKTINEFEAPANEDTGRCSDAESVKDPLHLNASIYSLSSDNSEECLRLSTGLRQDINDENEPSSSPTTSTHTFSITEKNEDVDVMSDATSKPSPISVLEAVFKEDDNISPPIVKSFTATESIQPRQICFEEQISASSGGDKYTVDFVKAVVQMSGLTWAELLRRSLLSDHLIKPTLLDEVDFLPDLLSCDFILLFDLIIEVLTEICRVNFTCMLSLTKPLVHPELKGKDIFVEVWKGVEWYLKLEKAPHTLDQTVTQDLAKETAWMDRLPDSESVGILVQEAILDELVEDVILNCGIPLQVEAEETTTSNELL